MAVVCRPLVLALLLVDDLHLLLKAHLVDQLLHLALVVGLVGSSLTTHATHAPHAHVVVEGQHMAVLVWKHAERASDLAV